MTIEFKWHKHKVGHGIRGIYESIDPGEAPFGNYAYYEAHIQRVDDDERDKQGILDYAPIKLTVWADDHDYQSTRYYDTLDAAMQALHHAVERHIEYRQTEDDRRRLEFRQREGEIVTWLKDYGEREDVCKEGCAFHEAQETAESPADHHGIRVK